MPLPCLIVLVQGVLPAGCGQSMAHACHQVGSHSHNRSHSTACCEWAFIYIRCSHHQHLCLSSHYTNTRHLAEIQTWSCTFWSCTLCTDLSILELHIQQTQLHTSHPAMPHMKWLPKELFEDDKENTSPWFRPEAPPPSPTATEYSYHDAEALDTARALIALSRGQSSQVQQTVLTDNGTTPTASTFSPPLQTLLPGSAISPILPQDDGSASDSSTITVKPHVVRDGFYCHPRQTLGTEAELCLRTILCVRRGFGTICSRT